MRKRFLAISVLGSGLFYAGVLMGQSASQPAKPEMPSAAARLAAAQRVCEMLHDAADGTPQGQQGVEHTYVWSMRRMEAQRDVDATRGERFAAIEAHLMRMREFEVQMEKLYKQHVVAEFALASTQFYVAEAEELLARERAK